MSRLTDKLKSLLNAENANLQATFAKGTRSARIISVCSQKGGVGKTTTASNLGAILSKNYNKKVLVVDLDPQGHIEKSLGALIPEGIEYTPLSSVLTAKKGNILDAVIPTTWENLNLTPGDKELSETESILASKIGKEFILSQVIDPALSHYDFIIFDCPPNLGNLTLNALVCSEYCIVPCEMSVLSFEGVSDLLETLELVNERLNAGLDILGVLFTRVDKRNTSMNEIIYTHIQKQFGKKVFRNQIAVNTALNKAQLAGLPIFEKFPSSKGAKDYQAFSEEFIEKLNKTETKKNKSSNISKIRAKQRKVS
ncbi:MAG: ParA family protein [Deltaproteobacteria bacterium]|nr:ParA family protein [Deltaproteobacteria bacterium]